MIRWPKIVSIVELDPQALLTFGTHVVKKHCCIHYDAYQKAYLHDMWYIFALA